MNTTVSFRQDTCTITLYLPAIVDLPIDNIRKLFKMMLSEPWNNQEAIDVTDLFLPEMVGKTKADADTAALDYKNGYKSVANHRSRAPFVVDALRENKRLTHEMKQAQAVHAKWLKIQEAWTSKKEASVWVT